MKENVTRVRRQATEWKKKIAEDPPDKGLLSKTHKECLKINTKTNLIKKKQKWASDFNKHLTQKVYT